MLTGIRRVFTGFVSLVVLLGLFMAPAGAGKVIKTSKGNQFPDGPIDDDLLVTGLRVEIGSPVLGDVAALAKYVSVDTSITGALVAVCEGTTISGEVGGSVLALSSDLVVDGRISGTVGALAEHVSVNDEAILERDLYVMAQESYISGRLKRSATIAGRYVGVSGEIDGDVLIHAEEVEIMDGAVIGGDLEIVGCLDPIISDGAEILGEIDIRPEDEEIEQAASWGGVASTIFVYLSLFVVGVMIVLVTRRHYAIAAEAVTKATGRSLAFGILGFGVGLGLFIILLLTLIGALAAFISLGLLVIFMTFLGQLYTAGALGSLLISADGSSGAGRWIGALLVGLVIIAALSQIPVAGWIVYLLSGLAGLGGFIIGFLRCRADADPSVQKFIGSASAN